MHYHSEFIAGYLITFKDAFQIVVVKSSRHCEERSNLLHNQVDEWLGIASPSYAKLPMTQQLEMYPLK